MKTNQHNQPTPSGTPTQSVQAFSDTNQAATYKDYTVKICWARFDEGRHTITAKSRAEALEAALKIKSADLDDDRFYPIDSVIQVISVEVEKEGQSHE